MEKTEYGSLIAFTKPESELRESAVHAIASKIKDDYCLLPGATIQNLDDIENALIKVIDGEVVEFYLNEFISECKNAISDHKL